MGGGKLKWEEGNSSGRKETQVGGVKCEWSNSIVKNSTQGSLLHMWFY